MDYILVAVYAKGTADRFECATLTDVENTMISCMRTRFRSTYPVEGHNITFQVIDNITKKVPL